MALHVQSCGTQEGMWSTSGRHALMGALDVVMMDLPQDSTHSNGLVEHLKKPQKMSGFFCEKNLGPSSDSSHRLAVFGPGEFRRLEI